MHKKILLLMALILVPSSFAYTIFDLDNVSYSGDQTTLFVNNWRNASTNGGLPYCNAASGYATCVSPTTFAYSVHHLFNQVPDTYCLSSNNSYNGGASNFSIRFNYKFNSNANPTGSQRVGITSALSTNPSTDLYLLTQYNVTGNSKYCLTSTAASACINQPTNLNWHRIQIDYDTYEIVSAPPNVSIATATLYIDGINITTLTSTAPTPIKYSCLNSTAFTLRNTGFDVDDIVVINYNETDTFINANASVTGANVTYQCTDGLDNDGDGFFDMEDVGCTSPTDDSELPFNLVECSDSIDNDGDLLTDYPEDTGCANATDNSESPQNFYQCNDGADNDGDGLIDFPQDPSCDNYSDNVEAPADATIQEEDTCSLATGCIFIESIPYSDSIYLHDWYDISTNYLSDVGLPEGYSLEGGYSLRLGNYEDGFYYTIQIYKYFQNDINLFNSINGRLSFEIYMNNSYDCNFTCTISNSTFYAVLEDYPLISVPLKFVVEHSNANVNLYYSNLTGDYLITTFDPQPADYYHVDVPFSLSLYDNMSQNTITLFGQTFPFYNASAPNRLRIVAVGGEYDSRALNTFLALAELHGVTSQTTICSVYSPPIYLFEEFNYGKMSECGWNIIPSDLIVQGKLAIDNNIAYFNAHKATKDTTTNNYVQLESRYVGVSFDITPYSSSTESNILSMFIYGDLGQTKVATISFTKTGLVYSYPDGNPESIYNLPTDISSSMMLVFDLVEDDYDLYVDGSLQEQSIQLDSTSYDYTNIFYILLSSQKSKYDLDNLKIYTSDATGNPLMSQPSPPTPVIDNTTTFFGLFFNTNPPCFSDADCLSGKCGLTNKCSSFNWQACDDNGYARTNWCIFKLIIKKGMTWIGDLIMDNFLLFIIFLILLMIIVYFVIMFRRGG
jgi:hypothetical protein